MNDNKTVFVGARKTDNHVIRFDVRKGHFTQWVGQGQPPREYDFVQGYLTGITLRKRETQGGEMTCMDMHFVNGETRFDVSTLASGSVSAEIISKLVNVQDVRSLIRIDVWPQGAYTNCTVRENGEKLPFRILPKVVKKPNGFSTVIDSSERDAAVMHMIDELNTRLKMSERATTQQI